MITPKQDKFARCIASGMRQIDAYREAYNAEKMQDNSISREASLLVRDPNVAQRIQELRNDLDDEMIMSARERAVKLTDMARNGDPDTSLKAMEMLNKMTGRYTQKVEANVSQEIEVNITLGDD